MVSDRPLRRHPPLAIDPAVPVHARGPRRLGESHRGPPGRRCCPNAATDRRLRGTSGMQHSRLIERFAPVLVALWLFASAARAEDFDVNRFGALGDGKADETKAFQSALDAAHAAGGGVVQVPRGNYRFAGTLNVPS